MCRSRHNGSIEICVEPRNYCRIWIVCYLFFAFFSFREGEERRAKRKADEEARRAKAKAHLAWARNQTRGTNLSRGSLHENPPSKPLGGGGTASRGRGRGSSQGRGKGRDKGGKGDRSSSAKL